MSPVERRLCSPRFVFLSLSLLVLLAFALSPMTRKRIGIFDGGYWFMDSHAVLAGIESHRAGIAAGDPNPFDVMQRTWKYSDWWYGLGKIGLTLDDNFLLGGSWVLGFLAVVSLTVRPTRYGEALWLALLLSSPPFLLAINRANNDLVVFSLLGFALIALRTDSNLRVSIAIGLVALASGLKFYPVVALLAFFLVRPRQRIVRITAAAVAVIGAALASVASQIGRGSFSIESKPHRLGGRMLFTDAGLSESRATLVTIAVFTMAVLVAVRFRWTGKSDPESDLSENRRMMTMGAVVLVACFLLGINAAYRWIFALWIAPWLWENRQINFSARLGVWLLPFCLWHDAGLCWVINRWFRNLSEEQYARIEVVWRAATEPFVWCLMILLGGWLLNLVWNTAKEVWRSPPV
ncbi:MAG: glycosyltransferase 87 family protein [Opitutaceae bacterium]